MTLVEDWVHGEVPLSKPPLVTTWAGVQAAAADGAAAAGAAGRDTAASAATASARTAIDLWGVFLTRNSFAAAGIPACSVPPGRLGCAGGGSGLRVSVVRPL